LYAEMWKPFIPEEQIHSFEFGGWFSVEVVPAQLAVFSLNTLYFFDRNAGVDGCADPSEPGFKQMEWLRIQLQSLRNRGMKAILMGHVPPAKTDSKQLWDETCWQKYNLWLRQYRDVVAGSVYGHMNIDHFVVHDTKEIDIALIGGTAEDQEFIESDGLFDRDHEESLMTRAPPHVSASGKDDYLAELRQMWSKLPSVDKLDDVDAEDAGVLGKNRKKKKKKNGRGGRKGRKGELPNLGGKWAERFHVSLISPSVVPNYFPTLRVIEYNITGLESDTPTWYDVNDGVLRRGRDAGELVDDELEDEIALAVEAREKRKENGDDKQGKGGHGEKHKKPKNPSLIVPDPPAKSAPPGPAYSPQRLSFTGYTQYFANLTHINNDIAPYEAGVGDEQDGVSGQKWRDGTHADKKPKNKTPKPRKFQFEVEYDTFTDKIYNLSDLTVKSYVKLASRIAERVGKKGRSERKHKKNKVWLHFLMHAFVSTEDMKDLKNRET
jgi:endopolyphosphatase